MQYLDNVDAFLDWLLLQVHISGGQPAKRAELLFIQFRNPASGQGKDNYSWSSIWK